MQLRRKRRKAIQHAKREAEAAWESLETGELQLAQKQMARAVAAAEHSATVWTDYARFLMRLHKLKEAEKAARSALTLDPDRADAHAALAEVLAAMGLTIEAYRSQAHAVRLQPGVVLYRELLTQYRAALPPDFRSLSDGAPVGPGEPS